MTSIFIAPEVASRGDKPVLIFWRTEALGKMGANMVGSAIATECVHLNERPDTEADLAIERYKEAIKKLGRNPNRYRISSEALIRRARREGEIPEIMPLVDMNNLLSIRTGWPVGCYDEHAIIGNVTLRLGGDGEFMETLGKGSFDIFNLPVLSDDHGAFGSTISDSIRTRIHDKTVSPLFVLYAYDPIDDYELRHGVQDICALAGADLIGEPSVVRIA